MHYEFTGKTKNLLGHTLHQIRATKDLPQHDVKSGDVGGWIESEKNLFGNAWVYGDARVYGNARVSGNALVSGGAWKTSPLYIQGSKWPAYMSAPDVFTIGCQSHTLEYWGEHYKAIARANGAEDIIGEYMEYYNIAVKRYGKKEDKPCKQTESEA